MRLPVPRAPGVRAARIRRDRVLRLVGGPRLERRPRRVSETRGRRGGVFFFLLLRRERGVRRRALERHHAQHRRRARGDDVPQLRSGCVARGRREEDIAPWRAGRTAADASRDLRRVSSLRGATTPRTTGHATARIEPRHLQTRDAAREGGKVHRATPQTPPFGRALGLSDESLAGPNRVRKSAAGCG